MAESFRDRIVDFRRVPASELRENPRNWRRHPATQASALREVLSKVGYADAVLARETSDGLELVDGHLRKELTPEQELPVLVLDLSQEEADLVLATHDPLAAMATVDEDALESLLRDVAIPDANLEGFLAALTSDPPFELGGSDDPYSHEVQLPQYEIVGEKPQVRELADTTKTDELRSRIAAADIPDDVRAFLYEAAGRHTIVNYRKVAEFYPHAEPEVQKLFEDSALVIIDLGDAIQQGYVRFTETIEALLGEEIEDHGVGRRPGGVSREVREERLSNEKLDRLRREKQVAQG